MSADEPFVLAGRGLVAPARPLGPARAAWLPAAVRGRVASLTPREIPTALPMQPWTPPLGEAEAAAPRPVTRAVADAAPATAPDRLVPPWPATETGTATPSAHAPTASGHAGGAPAMPGHEATQPAWPAPPAPGRSSPLAEGDRRPDAARASARPAAVPAMDRAVEPPHEPARVPGEPMAARQATPARPPRVRTVDAHADAAPPQGPARQPPPTDAGVVAPGATPQARPAAPAHAGADAVRTAASPAMATVDAPARHPAHATPPAGPTAPAPRAPQAGQPTPAEARSAVSTVPPPRLDLAALLATTAKPRRTVHIDHLEVVAAPAAAARPRPSVRTLGAPPQALPAAAAAPPAVPAPAFRNPWAGVQLRRD